MASNAFEAEVNQHIEAIKAANVYAAMSGSIDAVQPAEAFQRALDVETAKRGLVRCLTDARWFHGPNSPERHC